MTDDQILGVRILVLLAATLIFAMGYHDYFPRDATTSQRVRRGSMWVIVGIGGPLLIAYALRLIAPSFPLDVRELLP
jgi:hypothetical protein